MTPCGGVPCALGTAPVIHEAYEVDLGADPACEASWITTVRPRGQRVTGGPARECRRRQLTALVGALDAVIVALAPFLAGLTLATRSSDCS